MSNNLQEKQKRLRATMGSINKKYGAGTVSTAAEALQEGKLTKKIIPSSSVTLNDAMYGGFSGVVELAGANSSGKTSLAIETIVNEQKRDPEFIAAWMETEGSIDENILSSHGVDMNRLVFWRQEDVINAENALDIARGFIVGGDVNLLVVNSVAGLAPKTEIEDDLDKQNIALVARLLSKFFRVSIGSISKNNITAIFINQLRDKVGVMFGDPSTTTGGRALSFYANQRVFMNRLSLKGDSVMNEEQGVKIGFKIKKNRLAGTNNPFTKGEYYARYNGGIDNVITMPERLLKAKIVRQAGAYWYYEDANGNVLTYSKGACKWRSKNDFLTALREDEDLRARFELTLSGKAITPETMSKEEAQAVMEEEAQIAKEMQQLEESV